MRDQDERHVGADGEGCAEPWSRGIASVPAPQPCHPGLSPDAVDYAVDGLDKFNTEKEVAQYLRKAFVDKVCRRHSRTGALSLSFASMLRVP